MKRIKENMIREHERKEIYYNFAMNDLINLNNIVQSLHDSSIYKRNLNNNNRNLYEIHNNYRYKKNEMYLNM